MLVKCCRQFDINAAVSILESILVSQDAAWRQFEKSDNTPIKHFFFWGGGVGCVIKSVHAYWRTVCLGGLGQGRQKSIERGLVGSAQTKEQQKTANTNRHTTMCVIFVLAVYVCWSYGPAAALKRILN